VRGSQATILVGRARRLRHSHTEAERRFWNMVRNRELGGLKFVRQMPIANYIVDFVCRERMLVVELDGSQHADSTYDEHRTRILNGMGYSVLRFWNDEVILHRDSVQILLAATLAGDFPSPGWRFSPAAHSPAGRGADGATIVQGSLP
jgi:very-short-patch-repair endonuclease